MNGEHWTDRLSDYLDGELDELDRREADAHLASCGDCRTALEELRQVVHLAGNLVDRSPESDLWPEIAAGMKEADTGVIDLSRHMEEPGPVGRRSFRVTVPQLAAAGIALILATGALTWSVTAGHTDGLVPGAAVDSPVTAVSAEALDPELSSEIERLEATLNDYRERLQPETVARVERNLQVIDRAIRESLEALDADPGSALLRSLADRALQRKVEFLRGVSQVAGRAL